MKKPIKLVTHNGSFHADDIFAAATLSLFLESKGETFEIIRTRDQEIIESGDYVFDVGGIYDESTNRFDHHQKGGAGQREDGIPYAAFGLVWKRFGIELCVSSEISDNLEKKIVEPIDANDNGVSLYDLKGQIAPISIQDIFMNFRPSWKEVEDYDVPFLELVDLAKKIITREIIRMRDTVLVKELVLKNYSEAQDKHIIILDDKYPWGETLEEFKEPLFVISLKADKWRAEAVRKQKYSFEVRKPFPSSWGGLRDEELQKITGVDDAVFCHRGLFLAVAKTKEGAIKLAQIAVES